MPNYDKTGPEGKGPRTGRGLGDCPSPTNKEEKVTGRPQRAQRGGQRGGQPRRGRA